MPLRVTYIISDIEKAMAYEWVAAEINSSVIELSFILYNNSESYLESFLKKKGIKVFRIGYRTKKDLVPAVFRTISFLKKNRTQAVHTHLFTASFIGLLAARLAGIKRRIYSRHYSTLNHSYFPNAVKWDKLINYLSTDIVAISENVKNVLVNLEGVKEEKITVIHHGFMLEEFSHPDENAVKALRNKYNPAGKKPVIGVISRYIELKGVQFIIPAFRKILEKYPDALLLLFNAKGEYEAHIKQMLEELPRDSYCETVFEPEITSLYRIFDVFVHVPVSREIEAFGQTYIESLAAGIPSVFTISGVASEFISHRFNAMVVDYKNSSEIYNSILELLDNKDLYNALSRNGTASVQQFSIDKSIKKLESLYLK